MTIVVATLSHDLLLKRWMKTAHLASWKALAQSAGVSMYQVRQLRHGHIETMRLETLGRLARSLGVSTLELLEAITGDDRTNHKQPDMSQEIGHLRQEYERLQEQLNTKQEDYFKDCQKRSLAILEPWLLNWYRIADVAQRNQQIPASKLIPFGRYIDRLLEDWGVVQIAPIGEEVAYDPRWHQVENGSAQPGDRVRVTMPGFRHGPKLLHRAHVSRV